MSSLKCSSFCWGTNVLAEGFIITPASTELKGGYTGFTLSVCPSVHSSVHPSVCGWNRVCSVSSTILAGSISYLYIFSRQATPQGVLHVIFSCDQAALWMVQSVCLSVCLSVRLSVTPFWLCSHHRIIMKFSGVITNDKSDVHAKGQGQRSKVKVTEVNTQLSRFRTVTPVWIHIWWWNDAQSLMLLRRGGLLFFKVICQISRSHG